MNYQAFRSAFEAALRDSGLPVFGVGAEERLDLHTLDRIYRISVEPIGGQDAEPFFVTASLSWRWSALQTARTITIEEDVVSEMLADRDSGVRTETPWIRVDVALKATLPHGSPLPMPPTTAMWEWFRETMTRIEQIEPLTSEQQARDEAGRLALLAWQQGEPRVHGLCGPDGQLVLDGVEVAAWQAVEVPRIFDDPDQKPDAGPHEELAAMFRRARAALTAWMQTLDHLRR